MSRVDARRHLKPRTANMSLKKVNPKRMFQIKKKNKGCRAMLKTVWGQVNGRREEWTAIYRRAYETFRWTQSGRDLPLERRRRLHGKEKEMQ